MFGLSNIKLIIYGMILAALLGMGALIKYQSDKINTLTSDLDAAKLSLVSAKEVIAKMTGAKVIDERLETFIGQGQSFVAGEHQDIADELKKSYEDYLLNSERERICLNECGDYKPEGPTCPLPKGYLPNPKDEKMKADLVDNAWKNYCVANRTAEGCK